VSRNEYSDTVRDLHALIRREEGEKRDTLSANLDRMAGQLERQRDQLGELAVLKERVDGLVWLVRSVIVVCALEIVSGIVVALLVKGRG